MITKNELYFSLREMMWKAEEFRQTLNKANLPQEYKNEMKENFITIMQELYDTEDIFREIKMNIQRYS